jgi:predicted peptidase
MNFRCKCMLMSLVMAFVGALPAHAAALKQLTLQATGGVELSPQFNPATRSYHVDVQSDISAIQIQAEPQQEGVSVAITVNGQPTDPKQPMQAALSTGKNHVRIRLSGAAGDDYELIVNRQDISAVVAKFLKLEFIDPATGARMPYRLYVPENMSSTQKYPLVVFLHGGGERGDDNEKTLTANQGGTVWALPQEQAKRPAFVLVPQARAVWDGGFGVTRNPNNEIFLGRVFTQAEDTKTAHKLLMKVLQDHPRIDRDRLYATGLSQGGFGVWAWNIAHPDLFAATVAIAGGANPAEVGGLRHKPIWVFHAAADPVIPVSYSQQSVQALRALGSQVRYTEYPNSTYFFPMAHFSWVPALRNSEMREWLFQQKR